MDITIGVIIAVIALFSPVITTRLNNKHQLEIRKLEIDSENKNNKLLYNRELCERYLCALARCFNEITDETKEELIIRQTLISPIIPEDVRSDFRMFTEDVLDLNFGEDIPKNIRVNFNWTIIPTIEKILQG